MDRGLGRFPIFAVEESERLLDRHRETLCRVMPCEGHCAYRAGQCALENCGEDYEFN